MKRIQLLDCTLRDGGFVNDWNFGYSTIRCIFDRLVDAGLDMIEIGLLDDRRPFDRERSIQPDTKSFDILFKGCDKGRSVIVAMIDYGTCDIDNIAPCDQSCIDAIRVIFKRPNMEGAVAYGKQLVAKGYRVFLQLVSITSYSDRDILDFVDKVNEMALCGVSMVDTYGLMHKEEMLHYFNLLDHNLNSNMMIGYHSHNNFQLGYSNEIEMLKHRGDRSLIVDGTVYGMGKSAGNAPLELLATYLNENCGKQYALDQILEIIDVNIMKIFKESPWGYSHLYFLSASNNCHPSYIHYLIDKKTLSIKAINTIAGRISAENKLNYNQEYIEKLYELYQNAGINADATYECLSKQFSGQNLLMVGPGKSVQTQADKIKKYIADNAPLIISVNSVPPLEKVDYVFLGNAKRYSMLYNEFATTKAATIASSNVTSTGKAFDYVVNYEDLHSEEPEIRDNALIMLLNLLVKIGVKEVALAGFDGFNEHSKDNFYNDYMRLSADYSRLQAVNIAIAKKLKELRPKLKMEFITTSLYVEEK